MKKIVFLLLSAVLISCLSIVSFAFQPEKPVIDGEFFVEDDDSLILRNLEDGRDPNKDDDGGETVVFTAENYKKLVCAPFIRLVSVGIAAFVLVFVITAIPKKQKNI